MGAAMVCAEPWVLQETQGRKPAVFQTLYNPGKTVEVAATSFGPGVPGVRAYHTSIMIEDVEYSFSINGVTQAPRLASHQCYANKPMVMYMGLTSMSGQELLDTLGQHFRKGTYDLLRKNCNSFSDCAMFFLLRKRLDAKYSVMERLGASAGGLVQAASSGQYSQQFSVDAVIRTLDCELPPEQPRHGEGQTSGGTRVQSVDELRAARLARLAGGAGSGVAGPQLGASHRPDDPSSSRSPPPPPSPPPPSPPPPRDSSEMQNSSRQWLGATGGGEGGVSSVPDAREQERRDEELASMLQQDEELARRLQEEEDQRSMTFRPQPRSGNPQHPGARASGSPA
eukprot:CAMPEP_0115554366 /NCGR_PEP_ID=MMETSP0271-20121206/97256_1 /TAXON_ID=71861 /ORGANISM="Scrippsiella trochoidea, Strain CCMP3099" /LENGTH=339 /DNA_ID=CAMNT_0002988089 /DNA_START=1 /DNA_END=1018 /DNA_ORIENTATION=+